MATAGELKPCLTQLTDVLQQLRAHTTSCKTEQLVLGKNVVMPLFRSIAQLQQDLRRITQERRVEEAVVYVEQQITPSIKRLGTAIVKGLQDFLAIFEVEAELQLMYKLIAGLVGIVQGSQSGTAIAPGGTSGPVIINLRPPTAATPPSVPVLTSAPVPGTPQAPVFAVQPAQHPRDSPSRSVGQASRKLFHHSEESSESDEATHPAFADNQRRAKDRSKGKRSRYGRSHSEKQRMSGEEYSSSEESSSTEDSDSDDTARKRRYRKSVPDQSNEKDRLLAGIT